MDERERTAPQLQGDVPSSVKGRGSEALTAQAWRLTRCMASLQPEGSAQQQNVLEPRAPGVRGVGMDLAAPKPESGMRSPLPASGCCGQEGRAQRPAARGCKHPRGASRAELGRAAPWCAPRLHPLGLPAGPARRPPASLPLQLPLQPLFLLLQVIGHVVAGGLVEAAEAPVRASRACAEQEWVPACHRSAGALLPAGDAVGRRDPPATLTTRLSVDLRRLLCHGPKDAHLLVATAGCTKDSLLTGHVKPGGPQEARCRGCG